MNLYESLKNNLKESSKEELVNSLINYLYDTYGDNFKLEDNVNGYTKNEEIYETLVTQYLEEKPDISFVEWVKNIIDEPHGLLEVKVNDTVKEGLDESVRLVYNGKVYYEFGRDEWNSMSEEDQEGCIIDAADQASEEEGYTVDYDEIDIEED